MRSACATTPATWRCSTPARAKQGGRPLFDQQIVQLKLNKMHMLTEALRSFVMRVAWEHDQKMHSANAGLAMNFSTDVIQEVTELNMDIHGGGRLHDEPACRQAGARLLHLEPPRRRYRAAHEGRAPPSGAVNTQGAGVSGEPGVKWGAGFPQEG